MKLFGSTENKITKDKKGENEIFRDFHLEIPNVIYVNCNIAENVQKLCIHLFQINHLVNY